jgi:hypothetical protein
VFIVLFVVSEDNEENWPSHPSTSVSVNRLISDGATVTNWMLRHEVFSIKAK